MNYNAPRHGSEQLRTSLMTPLRGFYQGKLKTVLLILLAASFLSVVLWKGQRVHAATFTSTQSGGWENSSTWGGSGTPGPNDEVIISSGTEVFLQAAGDSCSNLTINGVFDLAGFDFSVSNYVDNGKQVNSGQGHLSKLVIVPGSGGMGTIAGSGLYGAPGLVGIQLSSNVTVTTGPNTVLSGVNDITIDHGSTFSLPSTLVVNGTTTIINNGTISGAGPLQFQGTPTINFLNGTTTSPIEGVSGTISCDSGTLSGNATIDAGAVLQVIANQTFTVSGNLTNNGTLGGGGTFNFIGSTFANNGPVSITSFQFGGTSQTLSGNGSFSSNNTSAVLTGATVTLTVDVDMGAVVVNSGGTLDITNVKLSLSASGAALTAGGTIVTTGSTVVYNGVAVQTAAAILYDNLTIDDPAGVTSDDDTTVNGTVTLNYTWTFAELPPGAKATLNGPVTGSAGILAVGPGTVKYNQAASNQVVAPGTYYSLVFNSFAKNLSNKTIHIKDTFTPGTATPNMAGSTVVLDGTIDQTLPVLPNNAKYNNASVTSTTPRNVTYASGTTHVAGNLTLSGPTTFSTTGNTMTLDGFGLQILSGDGFFNNLTLNNVQGATALGNQTVNNLLSLLSGKFNFVSPFKLTLNSAATTSGGSATSYVIGTVTKNYNAGANTFTFKVGTANGSSPVTANTTAASGAGSLTVTTVQATQPVLDPSHTLKRYWTLGGTGVTVNLIFNYLDPTDIAGNESNYRIIRVSGPTATDFPNNCGSVSPCVNTTANTATINGVSSFSDWTLGEPVAPTASNGRVSGLIIDSDGKPVEGAVIRLQGTQNRKTITDANGNYHFDEVETNGFYTVTPSRVNYNFAPSTRGFSVLGANTEASFMATPNSDKQNSLDTTEYFVRQQYVDFLGREPEEKGFNDWTDTINNCGAGDESCDRVHVSEMFYRSAEFQQRGYFVYRFYSAALGRKPDYAEFTPDMMRVSGFLTDEQLEAAKTQFANDFASRPAFVNQYGTLNNSQYVDALSQTAGVTLSNRRMLIDSLNAGTLTRAYALRQIAESGEVYAKYYNQAFVVMEYFGYLRRDPDILYLNWIQVLDANPSDSRHMVEGFVDATEYRNRFKQ